MPALIATIDADASPFKRELSSAEQFSKSTGKEIEKDLSGGGLKAFTQSGVMREMLVLMREVSRGNWSRVPGSLSILLTRLGALKYLLTPMVGILGGIAVAAGFVAFHFKRMADSEAAMSTATDELTGRFEAQAGAMQRAAEKAEEFHEWLTKLRQQLDNPLPTLERAHSDELSEIKRKFELEQKRARARGQTPDEAKAATIEEDNKEKEVIDRQASEAKFIAEQWARVAQEKEKAASSVKADMNIAGLKKAADAANDKLAKVTVQMVQNHPGTPTDELARGGANYSWQSVETHDIESNGKKITTTFREAFQAADALNKQLAPYVAKQKAADDAEKTAREKAKAAADEYVRKQDESKKAGEKIADDTEFGIEGSDKQKRALLRGHVNHLQSVGAYAQPAQVELLDVQKKTSHDVKAIRNLMEHTLHISAGRGVRH